MAKAEVTLTGVTTTTGGAKIQVPNHLFETVLYTGNGSTQTINLTNMDGGVDFVWTKSRSAVGHHQLVDSLRGGDKVLYPHDTFAEGTDASLVTAFASDSFTLGTNTNMNPDGVTMVAWCASLPNHTASNTDGTITSVTKNNDYMSVVSYTGNGTTASVGHSLGKVPELIIIKNRDDSPSIDNWVVYNATLGNNQNLFLNLTDASATGNGYFNTTSPTSTVFSISGQDIVNYSTHNFIAYAFASVNGVCKVSKYTGTGAAGNFVDCGFQPAFVMIKRTDSTGNWVIYDNKRISATNEGTLYADLSDAEAVMGDYVDYGANGFTLKSAHGGSNALNGTYIYLAIAETSYKTVDLHELTYGTQASAPTSAKVLDRSKQLTVSSKLFDGTKFNYTYGNYVKQGRAIATKLESSASGTTVISPITVNVNKS